MRGFCAATITKRQGRAWVSKGKHGGRKPPAALSIGFRCYIGWDSKAAHPATPVGRAFLTATWRSGYAEDCKSLHAGSIPAVASTPNVPESRGFGILSILPFMLCKAAGLCYRPVTTALRPCSLVAQR